MNGELIRREGFWWSEYQPGLPKPHPHKKPWIGKKVFLTNLAKIEEWCRTSGKPPTHYRGYSNCRICKQMNGSAEYNYRGWQWPSGYFHYIHEHNVRPSLAFQEFINEQFVEGTE